MADVKPATTEPNSEATKRKDPTQVRYIGQATERRISADDWALAGVLDEPPLILNRNESMPLSALSPKAIEVLKRDGNFSFE